MATATVTETGLTRRNLQSLAWEQPRRPWLTLYGLRVRMQQDAAHEEDKVVELAPIQKQLPEEMLLQTFGLLHPYTLGKVACVCRQWSGLIQNSVLWRAACREAFGAEPLDKTEILKLQYKGSWRVMFLQRPHLRFDGLFVSRNTYIRTGITEWRIKNPVHMVCYFRYLRFLPDGRFLYRTSPEVVSKVAKSMRAIPSHSRPDDPLCIGRWQLKERMYHNDKQPAVLKNTHTDYVWRLPQISKEVPLENPALPQKDRLMTAMRYPNTAQTEIRSRLVLRSTTQGANNRLDVENIVSYDRFDGSTVSMIDLPDWEEAEQPDALSHRRGLAPYVFVPEDEVSSHILNQSDITKMDFFLPG